MPNLLLEVCQRTIVHRDQYLALILRTRVLQYFSFGLQIIGHTHVVNVKIARLRFGARKFQHPINKPRVQCVRVGARLVTHFAISKITRLRVSVFVSSVHGSWEHMFSFTLVHGFLRMGCLRGLVNAVFLANWVLQVVQKC